MKFPTLTRLPEADSRVEGMANIRGTTVPVIGLTQIITGLISGQSSELLEGQGKLIVTEYNTSLQAFHVAGVDRILRLSWTQIKSPPPLVRNNTKGAVTAVAMLDDGRMVLILDVEKILAEMSPKSDEEVFAGVEIRPEVKNKRVLFADDSAVARTQIRKTLERLGISYVQATTGQEAWDRLLEIADKAASLGKSVRDEIQMVLSDIEMPDMDGFSLTKHIRADPRFMEMPVILHSSLTGTCNKEKGKAVGASGYVTKFDPKVLGDIIARHC
jgi:two-component system chemotaxis response regulator CheV